MSRKTKRTVKHILRKVVRTTILMTCMILSLAGGVTMWFSSKFIPVYVNGEYVFANQLARYAIYALLFVLFIKSANDLGDDDSNRKRRK